MTDYLKYETEVLSRSVNFDDDSALKVCDRCGYDYYGHRDDSECKMCSEPKETNE